MFALLLAAGCNSTILAGASPDAAIPMDAALLCTPGGAPTCDGDGATKTCNQSGSAFVTVPCAMGAKCNAGVCGCVPGTVTCDGQDVSACEKDGAFHRSFTCPTGTACLEGRCDDLRCPDESQAGGEFALPLNAWPRYRHDNRNSGFTHAVVADSPKLKWKVFVGGTNYDQQKGMASGPVVNQDNVVFAGAGELDGKMGQLYAFDGMGKSRYAFAAHRLTGISTPAVRGDGTAYVASGSADLFAMGPGGAQLWTYKTGNSADGDPIVTREGTLIYPSDDGSLYALDPTGKLLWKSDPTQGPGEVDGGLAQACDGRILAGGVNGWCALSVKNGATLWKVPATGMYQATNASPVIAADGTLYGVDGGGIGYAIDAGGKVLWSRRVGPPGASAPLHAGDRLYVVANDGNLHALDPLTGNELWSRPVGYALTRGVGKIAGPVADGNMRVYVNSTDGFVYGFDGAGKSLMKLAASGTSAAQIFSGGIAIGGDGTMYVPGNDGVLYAFQ